MNKKTDEIIHEICELVLSANRAMPAHFSSNGKRTQSFCVEYDDIDADDEYEMASQSWHEGGKAIAQFSKKHEQPDYNNSIIVIKIGEDIMIGSYIAAKIGVQGSSKQLQKLIIESNLHDFDISGRREVINQMINSNQIEDYFTFCRDFGISTFFKYLFKKYELVDQIISNTENFIQFIAKNYKNINKNILKSITKESLAFYSYCAIFILQNNDLSNKELDFFTKVFYKNIVKAKLLSKVELLDYEELSRKRYVDFSENLFKGKEEQLTGKQLNSIIAKETLYIQSLLSIFDIKKDDIASIYSELFSTYDALTYSTQLMFALR